MSPSSIIGSFQCTIFSGAKFTPLEDKYNRLNINNDKEYSITTLAARSCDSHFRQNHGPVGT